MSLSLDDKLLGEKVHNYCSSSEDESQDDDKDETDDTKTNLTASSTCQDANQSAFHKYKGYSTNTGPKGVINDWREFKRLETERRERNEQERQTLAKNLSVTCRSYLNETEEIEKDGKFLAEIGAIDDDFLQEYRLKRIEEMRRAVQAVPTFGRVVQLSANNYVEAIDKERSNITIIIHVYSEKVESCAAMNGCFVCLAKDYPSVKFCKISALDAKLSLKFALEGVPAILVYRNKQLIGNYVRLSDELGDDFFATNVERFLHEHGMLPHGDNSQMAAMKQAIEEIDDSDFDVD